MNWNQLIDTILHYKVRFITVFFLVFIFTYAALYIADFLPEAPTDTPARPVVELTEEERAVMSDDTDRLQSVSDEPLNIEIIEEKSLAEAPDYPVSIRIEKLGRTIDVMNPASRTIADLDAALLNGVVRHPDSAVPNQEGNVFILGHSSYLPNVFNKNFQAFNGIQDLQWGDIITLESDDKIYTYRVEKVYQAKASQVTVPIADTGSMLTLATCNSFGSIDDRYIVEAILQP